MRKIYVVAILFFATLSAHAQEKVMNILKTDGTTTQARVLDLKKISFLTLENNKQGLFVKTLGGETATVLFEAHPVVTASDGKLIIKYNSEDAVEFEITDIAEIVFGDATNGVSVNELKGFTCILQDRSVLFQGIPNGIKPYVYSLDGRCLSTPPVSNGELRLSRATMGTGVFIVKVGTFSTKIKL